MSLEEKDVLTEALELQRGEDEMDTIIRIDRSICPVYPDWMKRLYHPKLEAMGSTEYDLAKIGLYLHDDQKNAKRINGHKLYEHLKESDSLKNCLGLADALAIQQKGVKVFRELFGDKEVYCWKTIMSDYRGGLHVSCVRDGGREVVVCYPWLDYHLCERHPSALFPCEQ